ncbi:diguanylate cyclase [Blastopirellula marina]|uniref:Diguanylate cyclase n=1 Tax=Blastopirellula marina TaxID=124 RepID=A0A2S8GNZ9_9BACT|nr:diguanylate cyclase [Blastopirellula marina]PQO46148.1 hypothetical protein C5Y93_09160 [Blastopirellula marina]
MRNRLLVVENNQATRDQLRDALSLNHEVMTLADGTDLSQAIEQFRPELVLLDFHLPNEQAIEICYAIRRKFADHQIQLLILSQGMKESQRLHAFAVGADDIIDKSISQLELHAKIDVLMRLRNAMVRATAAEHKLEGYTRELERIVEKRSLAVQATQDIAVFALAKLADSRDTETGEHLVRMRAYSQMIAEQLRSGSPYQHEIDDQFLSDLYRSSPLHDIGKVGISDKILLKPGRLTPEEHDAMKEHVRIGADTLEEAASSGQGGSFFNMASQIARYHHERWDGNGYLEGLCGKDIPLAARIVSVADVFDALTSKRVYKDAYPLDRARDLIVEGRGTQFDPVIVDAFLNCFDNISAFAKGYSRSTGFKSATQPCKCDYPWTAHKANPEMMSNSSLLVVDNGSTELKLIANWMTGAGMKARTCASYVEATRLIREECPRVVITKWGEDDPDSELFYRWIREEHLPQYVYTLAVVEPTDVRESSTKAYRLGVDDVILQSISREELMARLNSAARVIELENHLRKIERHDPLTGLATLRYLNDQLKREWSRTKTYRLPICCMVVDVDEFKEINEKYGMEVGDKVLQNLSHTIAIHERPIDFLCRLDCDRLLLVLPESEEVDASRVAQNIAQDVKQSFVDVDNQQVRFAVSIGVAQRSQQTPNLESLISNARSALKVAKSSGKSRVVCFSDCHESVSTMIELDQVRDHLEQKSAAEIMTTPIFSIHETETVVNAVKLLLKRGVHSAPVVDEQERLVGVIAEKDLMQALRHANAWGQPVSEVMRRDVIHFEETEPAIHVYEFLSQAAIRRVIVVRNNQPTGVISRSNCLRCIPLLEGRRSSDQSDSLDHAKEYGPADSLMIGQLRDLIQEIDQAVGNNSMPQMKA